MKTFRQTLAALPFVRKCAMNALRVFASDISIVNSWSGYKLRLNSYRHRTYWYYGQLREREVMENFAKQVRSGDTVIEIGGHIGYITQYLSKLAGPQGRVIVFEPGSNNLPYLERNIRPLSNTQLVKAAVSSRNGRAVLYQDNLTGQNNSLLEDFKTLEYNAAAATETLVRTPVEVDLVTLDSYVSQNGLSPDFLKIDVEGHEHDVLMGAAETLRHVRALMVEVAFQGNEVETILCQAGLRTFAVDGVNIFAERSSE